MAATTTKMKGQNAAAMPSAAAGSIAIVNGSGTVIQGSGNTVQVNSSELIQALLLEVSEQRKMTEKALAQIDHLLSLLARLAARSTNRDLIEQYGADSKNPQRQ